ncbi:FecR family protein [Parapedobacter deserti]|uniref:FecR family protein n=1 Tax=Parapedobacter deserti TaxID=1912957 RepID=A0ABV7JKP0_9SPHI
MERSVLERYFDNTCSREEREEVREWLADERHSEDVKHLLSTLWSNFDEAKWAAMGGQPPQYEQIQSAIPALAVGAEGVPVKRLKRSSIYDKWLYVAAACVGFVVTIGALLWLDRGSISGDEYITVHTEKGERKQITLSDGSEIYLNADSWVAYPREMEMQHAAIYIEGEAFFNMTESDKPRIIKAGGVETRAVAGSSKFNITAFPADSVVTVSVDDGRAEIRTEYGPLLKLRRPEQSRDSVLPLTKLRFPETTPLIKLRPAVKMEKREYAVVHKERGEVNSSAILDEKKAFGWKDGILYFEDAGAHEIAHTLERWYGVKISFCKEYLHLDTYSAEFNNAQLPSVLSDLSRSLQLNYTQEGNEIYLCSK